MYTAYHILLADNVVLIYDNLRKPKTMLEWLKDTSAIGLEMRQWQKQISFQEIQYLVKNELIKLRIYPSHKID